MKQTAGDTHRWSETFDSRMVDYFADRFQKKSKIDFTELDFWYNFKRNVWKEYDNLLRSDMNPGP
jgi:molecular chaperone DnaK (HSP70)